MLFCVLGSLTGEGTGYHGSLLWDTQLREVSRDLRSVVNTIPVAGTAAMRNTKRGSWYIEALTQVFSERACDTHVADMLVTVSSLCAVFPLPPRPPLHHPS